MRQAQTRLQGLGDSSKVQGLSGAKQAIFVGSDRYRKPAFGVNHPLSFGRVSTVMDLCASLGWLPGSAFIDTPPASFEELARFHDRDYIEVLREVDARGKVDHEIRERYGIGTMENPYFRGMYERAATTVKGSILAAEIAAQGCVAFHPSGGTHHGLAGRAHGFCYFNDPVFAILTLLERGLAPVLYIDLDAHHGDGVQIALEHHPDVWTLSVHESDRWPYTGGMDDRGQGQARNLPVPAGLNDSEFDFLTRYVILPLMDRIRPAATVITCGADALDGDPLSGLRLSNGALWRAVEAITARCNRAVIVGGGGYNPWTTVRLWTGLWGRLSGYAIPEVLPPEACRLLSGLECDLVDDEDVDPAWVKTLNDAPKYGPIGEEVTAIAESVLVEI